MRYPSDELTDAERARLAPHFTNLDGPVFALVNLPETVKGALFARYSRYPGTLRRLFLDEFADSLPESSGYDGEEGKRAAELYERIFVGYGDDSVAQLGGAHVACEWTSNILTKILQRPRLGAYLEQSTRYIAYDAPMPGGGYRYYRDTALGPEYEAAMDCLFDAYAQALPIVRAWVDETYPRADGESDAARRRAVNAKAYDLLRGLLPAASLSHMGIYATGQAYEQLILHLLGHPLPEARHYGGADPRRDQGRDAELRRARRAPRARRRVGRLPRAAPRGRRALGRPARPRPRRERRGPPVGRLLHVDGDEEQLLAALLFEAAGVSEERTRAEVVRLSEDDRAQLLADLVGERANRRHRPGRGFEALRYRFEIVSDYGAFRDLQRHRMLTVQWQGLTPDLGAGVPEEVVEAGAGDLYTRALERSEEEYQRLAAAGLRDAAPYALCLGFRIRYVLDLNAREAMHTIELRSGREGHPSYRAVAHEMHAQIAAAPPGGRRGDDARRHQHRAAARAHPVRDAHRAPRARARASAARPPEDSVLVVVDAQPGFFAYDGLSEGDAAEAAKAVSRIAWMAGLAGAARRPAVVVEEGPERNGHTDPGILERVAAGTPVIEKPTFGLAAHAPAVEAIRPPAAAPSCSSASRPTCAWRSRRSACSSSASAPSCPRTRSTRTAPRARARDARMAGGRRRAQPLQGPEFRVAAHGRPRDRGLPRRQGDRHAALAALVNGTD